MSKKKEKVSFFHHLYVICSHLLTMMIVQGLWLAFTMLGVVVFGIGPATAAASYVVNEKIIKKKDESSVLLFWNAYKKHFLRANAVTVIIALTVIVLVINFQVTEMMPTNLGTAFSIGSYFIIFLTLLLVMYAIPFLTYLNQKLFLTLKTAIYIGMCRPVETISMLLLTYGIIHFYTIMPTMLMLLGIIPCTTIYTLLATRAWKKATKTKTLNQHELEPA